MALENEPACLLILILRATLLYTVHVQIIHESPDLLLKLFYMYNEHFPAFLLGFRYGKFGCILHWFVVVRI